MRRGPLRFWHGLAISRQSVVRGRHQDTRTVHCGVADAPVYNGALRVNADVYPTRTRRGARSIEFDALSGRVLGCHRWAGRQTGTGGICAPKKFYDTAISIASSAAPSVFRIFWEKLSFHRKRCACLRSHSAGGRTCITRRQRVGYSDRHNIDNPGIDTLRVCSTPPIFFRRP